MLENLLKITRQEIGGARVVKHNLTDTVDARELHKGLESKTRFNDWISYRLRRTLFASDVDYKRYT